MSTITVATVLATLHAGGHTEFPSGLIALIGVAVVVLMVAVSLVRRRSRGRPSA